MRKLPYILLIFILIALFSFQPVYAATGNAAVYYFTYTGSLFAGQTSSIQSYLQNTGYSTTRSANQSALNIRNSIGQNKIIHIWAHGQAGAQTCANSTYLTADYNNPTIYYALNYYTSLPSCKLIFFEGCSTANYSNTYGDLDNYAYYSKGVDSTIAYSNTIYVTSEGWGCTYFSMMVYSYACNNSYNISNATTSALSDTYLLYGQYYGTNSVVVRGGSTFIW